MVQQTLQKNGEKFLTQKNISSQSDQHRKSGGHVKSEESSSPEIEEIRQYHELMVQEGLSELYIQEEGFSIHLVARKGERRRSHFSSPIVREEVPAGDEKKGSPIVAPLSGVFYRASSPTTSPYVNVGDSVKQGQTICILEAMKVMNEIHAETAGIINKILVENGQPVQSGQVLIFITPV